jgi:SAM-dependent methyltransferase
LTAGTERQQLAEQYRLRFERTAEYRDAVWRVLCADYFSRFIRPDATVLDLGSGWGEFIRNIRAARKYSLDLNPDSPVRAATGVTSLSQDCATEWLLAPESLDVVFTSNLLEHLPSKAHIERTIAQAYRCLRPGGQLICLGPNITYVGGAYWDFWDHYIPLTERSMSEALRLSGFAVEHCIPRFLPYSMSMGRTYPLAFLKLYLKLPVAWNLFGKQFLVVGRKPATENSTR